MQGDSPLLILTFTHFEENLLYQHNLKECIPTLRLRPMGRPEDLAHNMAETIHQEIKDYHNTMVIVVTPNPLQIFKNALATKDSGSRIYQCSLLEPRIDKYSIEIMMDDKEVWAVYWMAFRQTFGQWTLDCHSSQLCTIPQVPLSNSTSYTPLERQLLLYKLRWSHRKLRYWLGLNGVTPKDHSIKEVIGICLLSFARREERENRPIHPEAVGRLLHGGFLPQLSPSPSKFSNINFPPTFNANENQDFIQKAERNEKMVRRLRRGTVPPMSDSALKSSLDRDSLTFRRLYQDAFLGIVPLPHPPNEENMDILKKLEKRWKLQSLSLHDFYGQINTPASRTAITTLLARSTVHSINKEGNNPGTSAPISLPPTIEAVPGTSESAKPVHRMLNRYPPIKRTILKRPLANIDSQSHKVTKNDAPSVKPETQVLSFQQRLKLSVEPKIKKPSLLKTTSKGHETYIPIPVAMIPLPPESSTQSVTAETVSKKVKSALTSLHDKPKRGLVNDPLAINPPVPRLKLQRHSPLLLTALMDLSTEDLRKSVPLEYGQPGSFEEKIRNKPFPSGAADPKQEELVLDTNPSTSTSNQWERISSLQESLAFRDPRRCLTVEEMGFGGGRHGDPVRMQRAKYLRERCIQLEDATLRQQLLLKNNPQAIRPRQEMKANGTWPVDPNHPGRHWLPSISPSMTKAEGKDMVPGPTIIDFENRLDYMIQCRRAEKNYLLNRLRVPPPPLTEELMPSPSSEATETTPRTAEEVIREVNARFERGDDFLSAPEPHKRKDGERS